MVAPRETLERAHIPPQNMASAAPTFRKALQTASELSIDGNQVTEITPTTKIVDHADRPKATTTQLIAAATSKQPLAAEHNSNGSFIDSARNTLLVYQGVVPAGIVTEHTLAKQALAVWKPLPAGSAREWPEYTSVMRNPLHSYNAKWQIPRAHHHAYEQLYVNSEIVPRKDSPVPFHLAVGSYVQRWSLWIMELKDSARRNELMEFAMSRMEGAWRHGCDIGLFGKPLQSDFGGTGRKGTKRDKNDETSIFEDDIETQPIIEGKCPRSGTNYRLTKKEFSETGASVDAINTRIAARDVAAGETIYNEFLQGLEDDQISTNHWRARTATTAANKLGRDIFVYALHEVQMAKQDIRTLKGFLRDHKTASQKKNTNNRIAEAAARVTHWLAIAIELDKLRPKDETESESYGEVEIVDEPKVREVASNPEPPRVSFPPREKKTTKSDHVSTSTSAASHEDVSVPPENVRASKTRVSFGDVVDEGVMQMRSESPPLTPEKYPGRPRLIVKLRAAKIRSDHANTQQKQDTGSEQQRRGAGKSRQSKRSFIEDSDDEYDGEEGEEEEDRKRPVVRQQSFGRRSKRQRKKGSY